MSTCIAPHAARGLAALILALSTSLAAEPPDAPRQPIPAYTVQRAVDAIAVDGKADEATWQKAARVSAFVTWDGQPTADATDVKMAWDDKAVYLLFVARSSDIQASLTEHDAPLYSEDVVEAYIDPEADGKTYMELVINPLNATLDNYCLCNPHHNPNSGILCWTLKDWQTAVSVDGTVRPPGDAAKNDEDRSWTVEMKIPFASVVSTDGPSGKAPAEGTVWGMALTRYDHPGGKFQHTAWSAPYSHGWPHMTDRFGKVTFSLKPAGE